MGKNCIVCQSSNHICLVCHSKEEDDVEERSEREEELEEMHSCGACTAENVWRSDPQIGQRICLNCYAVHDWKYRLLK